MLNPLDLKRLAVRIETLERQDTHDWMPGDEWEFRNGLHDDRVQDPRGRLPSSKIVRASGDGEFTVAQYRDALQVCARLESLVTRNQRMSPQRLMHDMMLGRVPGSRR